MIAQRLDEKPTTRVFYPLREGVLVTDAWFCADRYRYAVEGLSQLRWGRTQMRSELRSALRIIAAETVFVIAVMVGVATLAGPSIGLFALGALHLAVSGVLVGASAHRWPRKCQLWADYQGGPRLLYASADVTEFHKICRAAQRAIDYHYRRAAEQS
jgi:hypothetical protein